MKFSDFIAFIALIISLISLYQSKKSLAQSQAAQDQSQKNQIDDAKSELLSLISDGKSILNTTRIEIGALQAEYDAEPQPVQALLHNYTSLFDSYLPTIEAALAVLTSDWNIVNEWSGTISFSDLRREKAQVQDDLHNYENANSQAVHLIDKFREKLHLAREYASGATS